MNSEIAFETISFGMKPKEIIDELIRREEEEVKIKKKKDHSDKVLKLNLENNKDFKKPLVRKIHKIEFLVKLIFDEENHLNRVSFTPKPRIMSFAHCLQEAEMMIGLLAERYVHDKPEEAIEPKQILQYYRNLIPINHLIRLRKKEIFQITEWPDIGRMGRKAEILCNEHLTGKRQYTVKLIKYLQPPEDATSTKESSKRSIFRMGFNRDAR